MLNETFNVQYVQNFDVSFDFNEQIKRSYPNADDQIQIPPHGFVANSTSVAFSQRPRYACCIELQCNPTKNGVGISRSDDFKLIDIGF